MKKFLALLLSLAMILSLSVPAFAAESKDVKASYTPSSTDTTPAEITGVSITVDGVTYTEGNVTITPNTQSIILNVTGTNLQNGTQDNCVTYTNIDSFLVMKDYLDIGDDGTSATYDLSSWKNDFKACTTAHEIWYSNDNQATRINSGIYVIYNDGNTTFYDVTVEASENGTVKAPPKSVAGGEINLTVTPDAGYQLGTLTVTAGDGTTINPYKWGDSTYFFTMPADNVTVTATFVPEDTDDTPAKITGVSITVDGETYTEGNVTITPTSTVVYTVTGTNFANLSADNYLWYAEGIGEPLNGSRWTIDTAANTATRDFSRYISDFASCNDFEVRYSNDGQQSWTGTGIYLTYDDGIAEEDKAVITSVSITVDGVEYTSGKVTITPNTQSIIFTVSGTNFANLSEDNYLWYAPRVGSSLNSGWAIDTAANRVTLDFSDRIFRFESFDNFEVMYSNDGQQSWTGTGIYLTYVKPVPDSTGKIVVDMTDSYGDGWNDAAIEVYKNGSLETTATVDQFFNTVSLDYDSTATYEFKWVKGDYDEECSFTIYVDGESKLEVSDATEYADGETILTLGGTATTYTVTISDAITNGTVSATPNPAKEGATVTVTVAAETGYAYVVSSLKVTDATGGEVEVDEDTKTFVMPASNVTVTAEFEKLSTTSADIVWGSLAYTYTDGSGWANNDSSEDAGTVTVTNTSDTTIEVQPSYNPETGYTEITGSFGDNNSVTLEEGDEETFTLILSGQPNAAIEAGTKIGTVTIRIIESASE